MPTERPKALYYTGQKNRDGRPTEYFPGVPARDLTEQDLARLSDEVVAEISGSTLYQKSKPEARDDVSVKATEATPGTVKAEPPAPKTQTEK